MISNSVVKPDFRKTYPQGGDKACLMRATKRSPLVGMLNNVEPSPFLAKAPYAKKEGCMLVELEISPENIKRLSSGNPLVGTFWDGKSLSLVEAPIEDISMVYNFFLHNHSLDLDESSNQFFQILRSLDAKGKPFLNAPEIYRIAHDKWETSIFFGEHGFPAPKTFQFNQKNLGEALLISDFAFIKDTGSYGGDYQVVVSKISRGYSAQAAKKRQILENLDQVAEFASTFCKPGHSIVQAGIRVPKIRDRNWDIRAVFQRGANGILDMTTYYLRVGKANSPQANIAKGGYAEDPLAVFSNSRKIGNMLRTLGLEVIFALENKTGKAAGELGLDFIFDQAGKPYLLEINSIIGSGGPADLSGRLADGIRTHLGNSLRSKWGGIMEKMMSNPFKYAQHLWGQHGQI